MPSSARGFAGRRGEEAAAAIGGVNANGARCLRRHPLGVDARGEVGGAAVEADVTVTFHGWKVGLVVAPGRSIPDGSSLPATASSPRGRPVRGMPRRSRAAFPGVEARDSKFSAGSLLVVGGAPGTTSAAVLAATGALRADAGYVTLAVPAAALPVAETLALEPVKRGFEWASATEALQADVARSSAIALGPGLGRSDKARSRSSGRS